MEVVYMDIKEESKYVPISSQIVVHVHLTLLKPFIYVLKVQRLDLSFTF